MKTTEDMRERKKVPSLVGVGAAGVAELGAVGIVLSTVVLGSSRTSVAKGMNIQNNQRIASGSYKKKGEEKV